MRRIILLTLTTLFTYSIWAQHRTSMQTAPVDTALHMGVLENGLMYMIQRADVKKGVADFRLVQATGSLVEEDDQRGIAHFLEHMAFKGTKHFQGRAILDFLRRNGAQFGPDINAQTMMDHTTYILKEMPIREQANMDSCLLILRDWAGDITFDSRELEAERNVIVEEWRARSTLAIALNVGLQMYAGTRYVDRDPLGDLDIIRTCTAEQMKAFYRKWYQPQHQCVIVTGDVDPAKVETQIKRLFADLKPGKTELPMKQVLRNPLQPRVLTAEDKSFPVANFVLASFHPLSLGREQRLVGNLMREYIDKAAIKCLSGRLYRLKQNMPSIMTLQMIPSSSTNADHYTVNQLVLSSSSADLRTAISALLIELERAKRFGFTEKELEENCNYDPEKVVDDQDTTVIDFDDPDVTIQSSKASGWVADQLASHALRHTLPYSDKTYKILSNYFESHITPEMLRQAIIRLFPTRQSFVMMMMPEGEKALSEEDILALMQGVEQMELEPYADEAPTQDMASETALDPDIHPQPGTIRSRKAVKGMDFTQYTLSNGVRVVMNNVPDSTYGMRTQVRALLWGGTSWLEDEEMIYADLIKGMPTSQPSVSTSLKHPSFTIPMTFESNYTLYKYDHYDIREGSVVFEGERPANADSLEMAERAMADSLNAIHMELMFQKLHKTLTCNQVDSVRWHTDMATLRTLATAVNNPNLQAQLRLATFAIPVSARTPQLTPESLAAINQTDMERILARLHSNYNGMTLVINTSADPQSLLPLLEKYVASLPSQDKPAQAIDRPEHHIKTYDDKAVATITNPSPIAQVVLMVDQEKSYTYDSRHVAHGDALANVLNQLLINHIRIRHSDVYGIKCDFSSARYPYPQQAFPIQFTCDPNRAEAIISDVKEVLHGMADGDLITQTLLDSYLHAKENAAMQKEGDDADTGQSQKSAKPKADKGETAPFDMDRYMESLIHQGTIIERDNLDVVHSVTVPSLRRFVKDLLQNGHIYEFIMRTE